MKTYFSISRAPDGSLEFSGRFSGGDLRDLVLDDVERQLVSQAAAGNDRKFAANQLLVLEMLFRRRAEQMRSDFEDHHKKLQSKIADSVEGGRAMTDPAERGWRPIAEADRDATIVVQHRGRLRKVRYGKTSHLPWVGWCLADQGGENFDLINPQPTQFLPSAPEDEKEMTKRAGKGDTPSGT